MIRLETERPTLRPQAIPRADFPYPGAVPMERILVVEDDRAVQKALKRLFEAEGFAVEISADGKAALEAFRATTPAVIVLDLRLPSMSGRDVCREIKQQSPAVPIIVLSAASDVSDKVLLLELGADDYVTKPFSPRELLARVRAALRRTARTGKGEVFAFDGISGALVLRSSESKLLTSKDRSFSSRALFPFDEPRRVEFYELRRRWKLSAMDSRSASPHKSSRL